MRLERRQISLLCAATTWLLTVSLDHGAWAQSITDLKASRSPLILEQQGSFFVGGHQVRTDASGADLAPSFRAYVAGDITIEQMYVQFQIPVGAKKHVPIVFVHGCCLSAKTWETTPDGRMGWYEYFARKGHATYLADQTGRARSGFDATVFNHARTGTPSRDAQPPILMATAQFAWDVFRFGPSYGVPWPDQQFPMDKVDELYKQTIPDLFTMFVPGAFADLSKSKSDLITVRNMATLAKDLGGAILVGHSQSSGFPTQAALKDPSGVRGIIGLETGCFSDLTPEDVAILARIPILIVVGDHFATPQPPPPCIAEMRQINDAGGDMTFIALPTRGMRGNSHMMMQDNNNLAVADVLLQWISTHIENARRKKS